MIKNSARPNKAKNSALSERHELPYGWRPDKGEGRYVHMSVCRYNEVANPQEILGYTPKFRYVHTYKPLEAVGRDVQKSRSLYGYIAKGLLLCSQRWLTIGLSGRA